MTDDQALAARVDRLEADPPIVLSTVELTVLSPERLRRDFDEIFHYFALVEGEGAKNAIDIETVLPGLSDDDRRFLAVWSAHEAAHSAVFDAVRSTLRLDAVLPRTPVRARRAFRVLGLLAEIEWFHAVNKLVYLARGAMHERLTYDGYTHLGARLAALGERALARTVVDPIRRQEALHLGYYRMAAAAQRQLLDPVQVRVARVISIRTYVPVGAADRQRRAQFGRVFAVPAGDDTDGALEPVERLGRLLLGDDAASMARFVHRAMARCLGERDLGPASTGPATLSRCPSTS